MLWAMRRTRIGQLLLRRWIATHMADSAIGQRNLSMQRPEFRLRHAANRHRNLHRIHQPNGENR